ncbi:hypothetical protein LIER_28909 [Lithospermum erythrorhizon]|uniref:Uncharacterized protein n=1 Tax=Lithospermum erythrorhizon TaxID=34254 RepID=A0AAV3RKP3_LITER
MGGKSLKIDKFTGKNSFGLLQIKVRVLLKREGLRAPLLKPTPKPLLDNIVTLKEKAHSTLLSPEADIITVRHEQFGNASCTVAIVEDGANSEEDIALVFNDYTHYIDVWIPGS